MVFQGEDTIQGTFNDQYPGEKKYFELTGNTGAETFQILRTAGITPNYKPIEKESLYSSILINWLPMIFVFVIFFIFMRQLQAGGGKAMSFGKSKAKLMGDNNKKKLFLLMWLE